jgi:hypothetical protein
MRKLMHQMQANQDLYVQRALEFEAQVVRKQRSRRRARRG